MTEHYGEEWRPWPGGCQCHGDGAWYFMDYRREFAAMFDRIDYASPFAPDRVHPLYLLAWPSGDADEMWHWSFGSFSWTPNGDYWEPHLRGQNPTQIRAEAACREAAHNWIARMRASVEARA